MRGTYRTVEQLRGSPRHEFITSLIRELNARFSKLVLTPQQELAWEEGLGWIWDACSGLPPQADQWLVLVEYVAPLTPVRPDLVVVTGNRALVIEEKTGSGKIRETARKQVHLYASRIWSTVSAARARELSALLVSESCASNVPYLESWGLEGGVIHEVSPSGLSQLMIQVAEEEAANFIDPADWLEATYDVHPSIVEAAATLVAHIEDRSILTHISDDEELERLREVLIGVVRDAQSAKSRTVVLISGVPGAGKTLVGLRLAHDRDLALLLPPKSGTPLYLSGNGPLIEVMREAIARDHSERFPEQKKKDAKSLAESKIKLVRAVTADALPINSHVVVFDEGQRVWTAQRMQESHPGEVVNSEAVAILQAMETSDWGVLVVLVGNGQEINKGEAGAVTWLEAVAERRESGHSWQVMGSPDLDVPGKWNPSLNKDLHLCVSRRALSGKALSDWVNLVLHGSFEEAMKLKAQDLDDFPLFISRDLSDSRNWIWTQVHGDASNGIDATCGAFASAKSDRLRAEGLSVGTRPRDEFDWPGWFLDKPPSLHSAYWLELAASEFKCQGLELDYSLVGWSWDLPLIEGAWVPRSVDKRKGKWKVENASRSRYRLNAYRVLLTRCRRGMVIWVPRGSEQDMSRNGREMDDVAAALVASGVRLLPAEVRELKQ